MLNDAGGDDRACHALCLQLLSEHIVACLKIGVAGGDGWRDIERTVAFLETHVVSQGAEAEADSIKHALYLQVLTPPQPQHPTRTLALTLTEHYARLDSEYESSCIANSRLDIYLI